MPVSKLCVFTGSRRWETGLLGSNFTLNWKTTFPTILRKEHFVTALLAISKAMIISNIRMPVYQLTWLIGISSWFLFHYIRFHLDRRVPVYFDNNNGHYFLLLSLGLFANLAKHVSKNLFVKWYTSRLTTDKKNGEPFCDLGRPI